jgi:Flp pilus assembly protein TadG
MKKLKASSKRDGAKFAAFSALRRRLAGVAGEHGAALIEMAITSSILLSMLFGVIQMSLALYSYNFVCQAARQGSRWAIVRGSKSCTNTPNLTDCDATSAEVQTWVQSLAYPGLTSSNLSVTTQWFQATTSGSPATTTWSTTACSGASCNVPGNEVTVTVSYPLSLDIPFVPHATLNMASSSTLVISQ